MHRSWQLVAQDRCTAARRQYRLANQFAKYANGTGSSDILLRDGVLYDGAKTHSIKSRAVNFRTAVCVGDYCSERHSARAHRHAALVGHWAHHRGSVCDFTDAYYEFAVVEDLSSQEQLGSPDRFGHSWNIFNEILPIHEEQFLRWTKGIGKTDWQGKRFLDVGCGIGRNSWWPLTYGAASSLSIDIDERTLAAARNNLAKYAGAVVENRSAYEINENEEFDIAFSIGVIHHLDDQPAAVQQMQQAVKPGGTVLLWLYGYENNEWLIRYFDPVRRFLFSKMPLRLVYALSLPATALLWVFLRLGLGRTEYMRLIRTFSFRHLRAIVYDHMIPHIAKYYKKDEAIALLEDAGLENVQAHWVNEMSWTVVGDKPACVE